MESAEAVASTDPAAPAPDPETASVPQEPAATPATPEPVLAEPLVATMEPKPPAELTGEILAPSSAFRTPHGAFLKAVLDDALTRLLLPSLEREIRHELTDEAEAHAVAVFARNLRSLLLQPPLRGKRVLAVDPGFRAGCKVAALDESGILLDHRVIHPFAPPERKRREKQPAAAPSPAPAAADTSVPTTPASDAAPAPPAEAAPVEAAAAETTAAEAAPTAAMSAPAPVEVAAAAAPAEATTSSTA